MKFRSWALLSCAVFGAFCAFAEADVAVLHGRNNYGTDFDSAVQSLGIEADFYKCNNESIKNFCSNLDRYRLVMLDSLFNYAGGKNLLADDATDYKAVRKFVESGGVLVVSDAVYPNVTGWLEKVLGGARLPNVGKCNSSQWSVQGHTVNVEPVASIRSFPNAITQGNSWPHFEKSVDSVWRVVSNCSEGYPVVLTRTLGKGLVVVSSLRFPGEKILENHYAQARLRASGLDVKSFSMSPLAPGAGSISIELVDKAPKGTGLVCEVVDEKNRKSTFSTNFVGAVANLGYVIKSRGKIDARLFLDLGGKRVALCSRSAELPMLLKIEPPVYRGIISTKRRLPDVDFRVKLSPIDESLHGLTLTVAVFDSLSNCVFRTTRQFEKDRKIPLETDFRMELELPKDLSEGEYEVRAELNRYKAKSSAPFRVLAPRPAQTVIDEDNTFLVNGRPFFPLGIYHTCGNYTNIAELGFNTIQFWTWEMGVDHEYGAPMGLYRAFANGLRCLVESNHHGDEIYRNWVKRTADHPGILMWYVCDEPAEGAENRMRKVNDGWHKYDIHHPTYVLSCREDLFAKHHWFGDVFAFDPYGNKDIDGFNRTIRWMKKGREATDGRKALVCVPWATPEKVGDIRPIAYAALVHDARGIIWYCWKQVGGGPVGIGLNTRADCREVYKSLLAEIKTLMPGLLSVNRRMFENGSIHGLVCGDPNARDKRFVILLNVSDTKCEIELPVAELEKVKSVKDHFSSADVNVDGGKIKASFEPRGVKVYRW